MGYRGTLSGYRDKRHLTQPSSRNHSTKSRTHLRIESFNLDYSSVHLNHVRTTLQHDVASVVRYSLSGFDVLRLERAICFRSATAAVHDTQGHYLRSQIGALQSARVLENLLCKFRKYFATSIGWLRQVYQRAIACNSAPNAPSAQSAFCDSCNPSAGIGRDYMAS